jgi:hypothetical protein
MFFFSYAKQKGHNYYTILCSIVFCEHVHFVGPYDTVEFQITGMSPFPLDFLKLYIK